MHTDLGAGGGINTCHSKVSFAAKELGHYFYNIGVRFKARGFVSVKAAYTIITIWSPLEFKAPPPYNKMFEFAQELHGRYAAKFHKAFFYP